MQTAFTILITIQFVVILLHDLVEIPGWTHSSQLQSVLGKRKLWLATLVNAIFPGIAVAFAIQCWNRRIPTYASRYWLIYCAVTVLSAAAMWYLPYFLGASAQKREDYRRFYAGTRQILPPRGDNPRPNLLHVIFHGVFVTTLSLAVLIGQHNP